MGCTAFGGPQTHIPLFVRKLVDEKNFCSKEELLDINSFCSVLPGPSTTQTITALGFKLGGPGLAFLALLAWVLPGALLICLLALIPNFLGKRHLQFFGPMVAAFLCYAVFSMLRLIRKGVIFYFIFIATGIMGILFIDSPWIFPISLIAAAVLSANFGNRAFTPNTKPFGPIRWANLSLYAIIFLTVGAVGLFLTVNESLLGVARPIVLFENTYRMGSLAFGGGNTLAAMALDQYVIHRPRLSLDELNVGLGIVQGLPGPNFNLAVYINAMAMKTFGYNLLGQIVGALIGLVAIYMPGTLFVFFAYPFWSRMRTYPIVQRSLDGIFAASVGFVLTAAWVLNQHFFERLGDSSNIWAPLAVFGFTMLSLMSRRIPAPIIVLGAIAAGFFI